MALAYQAEGVVSKVKDAVKAKRLPKGNPAALVGKAVEAGVITADEADLLRRAEEARNDAVQVDAFTTEEYAASAVEPSRPGRGGPAGGDGAALGTVGFGDPTGAAAGTDAGAVAFGEAVEDEGEVG
jgi:acyl-CoA dehydrogenase